MTKKELLKSLESVPDDFEISVGTYDSYGMPSDLGVESITVDNDLQTVYLQVEEDNYSL